MIIKDINKKIKNTPDNINEELAPISEEYIKNLFKDVSGDDSNPLDYYTKIQTDLKINEVKSSGNVVSESVTLVEEKLEETNQNMNTISSNLTLSENTEYTTENGIKEFECKSGYVDNITIEGKTLVNIAPVVTVTELEGDFVIGFDKTDDFETNQRRSNGNFTIFNFSDKTINLICKFRDGVQCLIPFEAESCICNELDADTCIVGAYLYAEDGWNVADANNFDASVFMILEGDYSNETISHFEGTKSVGQGDNIEVITRSNVDTQEDKKQILTTLRSLPNGVKDTIEKRGNKYVKVQRCYEFILDNTLTWANGNQQTNTRAFRCDSRNYPTPKPLSSMYCDLFKAKTSTDEISLDEEYVYCNSSGTNGGVKFFVRIANTRLTTVEVGSFSEWLSSNPITVVYELETPIITELPNFNPQTFNGGTTFFINSGAIQAEANFEVTNSIGSEIEVLKDKASSLDEDISNIQKIHYSTVEPSVNEGKDGDLWVIYEE